MVSKLDKNGFNPDPINPDIAKQAKAKIRGGLTHSQDLFAKKISEGLPLAKAYKIAYPNQAHRADASVSSDASILKSRKEVIERVNYYIQKHEALSNYNPAKLRQVAIETIMEIAENREAKSSDRLKAAELIGKMSGVKLFEDSSNGPDITKVNTMISLEAKLRELAGLNKAPQPIDIIDQSNNDSALN